MIKKSFLLFFTILLSLIFISNAAQYYIIEDPSSLIIYNSYEARVNNMNKFLSYSPFEIINKNEMLGDGISEVLKVKYLGETYFILKDDDGNIEGGRNAGSIKMLNVTYCDDTLAFTAGTTIKSGHFPGKKNVTSFFNKSAIALFKYQNYFYLINQKESAIGWSKTVYWKKVKTKNVKVKKQIISKDQIDKLTFKIKEVNALYKRAFNYYNNKLNESKSAPYWKITKDGNSISFKLWGSKASVVQLEESSQYIVQEFLNILLGEPFDVKYSNGEIIVSPEEAL